MKRFEIFKIIILIGATVGASSCSTMQSVFGGGNAGERERQTPINNPFGDFYYGANAGKEPIVLRTKKGDRSVEVELPGSQGAMSDFVVPISPAFQDGRTAQNPDGPNVDNQYIERHP